MVTSLSSRLSVGLSGASLILTVLMFYSLAPSGSTLPAEFQTTTLPNVGNLNLFCPRSAGSGRIDSNRLVEL